MTPTALLAFGFAALFVPSLLVSDKKKDGPEPKEKAQMEYTGKLMHPVFAIGGETTGTVIETKKGTYELNLGGKKELLKQVEALKDKQVTVRGTLKTVKGLAVEERNIITITEIKEAKPEKDKDKKK